MSVLICGGCTARYAVGAEQCPQCGANEPREEHEAPLLASLTVACLPGRGCRYSGIQRRVMLPQIVPGVIDMPQLHCAGCGAALVRITDEPTPQQNETEDDVPKTTVHTGASHEAADLLGADGKPQPEQAEQADTEGGEDVSPGTSSSTSSEKQPTSPKTTEPEAPSPARKTGSRSGKGRTASSTAPSTATDQTASAADGDEG